MLSPADRAAIRDYSDRGYERMNQQLRDHELMAPIRRKVTTLTAALNRLPPYVGDVYRGTTLHDTDSLERYRSVGSIVTEDAFVSTSRSPLKMYGGNVLFYMMSKRGRDISAWSAHPEEEEILFRPASRFKVLAFTEADGDFEIFLEEI